MNYDHSNPKIVHEGTYNLLENLSKRSNQATEKVKNKRSQNVIIVHIYFHLSFVNRCTAVLFRRFAWHEPSFQQQKK